jgi:hypothetical protein
LLSSEAERSESSVVTARERAEDEGREVARREIQAAEGGVACAWTKASEAKAMMVR